MCRFGSVQKGESGETVKETLPTVKRLSLKALPRHLIIHLKRFEFDFETMQQAKINDRFEFPNEIDMFPYTLEGTHSPIVGHLSGYVGVCRRFMRFLSVGA
jgi:hypothetical protein